MSTKYNKCFKHIKHLIGKNFCKAETRQKSNTITWQELKTQMETRVDNLRGLANHELRITASCETGTSTIMVY